MSSGNRQGVRCGCGTNQRRIVGSLGGGELHAWAFSVYALLSTTTTPVYGRLSDRFGRKPVMLCGILVAARKSRDGSA